MISESKKALETLNFQAFSEVPTRFELVIEVLQTFALPLGYGTIQYIICLSFRRYDSKGI